MIERQDVISKVLLSAVLGAVALLVFAGTAAADLRFDQVGFQLTGTPTQEVDAFGNGVIDADGDPVYPETGPFERQAGSHPDLTVSFSLQVDPDVVFEGKPSPGPDESVHSIDVDLPPGMIGDPNVVTECDPRDFAVPGAGAALCPLSSQVGTAVVRTIGTAGPVPIRVAVYNLAHGPDVPARFGFNYVGTVALIDARVRPGDFGISAGSFSISQAQTVEGVTLTLWGVPADPSHDRLRNPIGTAGGVKHLTNLPRVPFLYAPTSCPESPAAFTMRGDAWQSRGVFATATRTTDTDGTPFTLSGCERLPFGPSVDLTPTTRAAETPSGLGVDLRLPQSEDPDGVATSHLRDVTMILPEGMSVSSSSASGLGACSSAQIGLDSIGAPECPASAKIGTVGLDTPVLKEQLQGEVLLARQGDNPFDSLLALYIVVKGPGFYLKLPGKITPDPATGRLTVSFHDNPQLPFERLQLDLNSGPRAPLSTPRGCGTYHARTELTPWSGGSPVVIDTPITVDQGCGSGGFDPKLRAGTTDPRAGSFSPFILQVIRADGEQNLARLRATLPEGLLAKLAGVPLCGEAAVAGAQCPPATQVGKVLVGSGPGPLPLYIPEPGKAPTAAYLAGPYKGAPYSLVVEVPAQAGPFDLGTVTVRNALRIDPTTTQVTADSDPLPQILQGIPIAYRDVRVEIDRPKFTINPTDCAAKKIDATLYSAGGQSSSPTASFAASECASLGFSPKLALAFKGPTKRTANPALTATLTAPPGQANIAKTTVMLPKTTFIDNSHINNPCTRVQFAEGDGHGSACPAKSILGHATAYSPLLDQPLSGPVYFRSNGGERELPDLVADLNGQIHVVLVGFIDSVKVGKESSRVRTRFQNVPDAPVSKFVLKLDGGKKGLIENSVNLCKVKPVADVEMEGQNGKPNDFTQPITTSCGKSKSKKAKGKSRQGH